MHTHTRKFIFTTFLCSILFIGYTIGQNKLTSVSITIDNHALHCPYLGPRMQKVFSVQDTVQNLVLDKVNSIATYSTFADCRWATREFIVYAVTKLVGYPEKEIKSIIIQ